MKVSPAIEDALWTAAADRLPAAVLEMGRLAEAVRERSRRYTSERERLAEPLSGEAAAADLAARALFFGLTDAAKIDLPLAELAAAGRLPAGAPLRVLDFGAGTGAMTLGLADFLARAGRPVDLAVVAVDRDAAALALMAAAAAALAAALGGRIRVDPRAARPPGAGYQLVLLGSVLNELEEPARLPLLESALAALDPDGAVIVIEPALRETSRALHQLRDQLIERGLGHVFAPCTRAGLPCPALRDPRDWCHEDRPLALTPRTARIAAATGLRDTGIKLAYLVVRREPAALVAPAAGREALRVVSEPRKEKGRRELVGCGQAGWVPLRLLKRHRAAGNRPFERARRGDLLVLPAARAAGGDLAAEDTVERVSAGEPTEPD